MKHVNFSIVITQKQKRYNQNADYHSYKLLITMYGSKCERLSRPAETDKKNNATKLLRILTHFHNQS